MGFFSFETSGNESLHFQFLNFVLIVRCYVAFFLVWWYWFIPNGPFTFLRKYILLDNDIYVEYLLSLFSLVYW